MDVIIQEYSISDLSQNNKPNCVVFQPHLQKAFVNNPFLSSTDEVAQIVGVADGRVVGGVFPFPLNVVADGIIYRALSGSTYWVEEKYRKSGLGIDLLEVGISRAQDKISIACGISLKARPIYELMGYSIFRMPRVVLFSKSRPLLARRMRGIALTIVAKMIDVGLACHLAGLKVLASVIGHNLRVEEIGPKDDDRLQLVERIVQADTHRFREEHNRFWFKWVLCNRMCNDVHAKQHLFLVFENSRTVAFFMTKVRAIDEQGAALRGEIIEWGVESDRFELQFPILLKALLSFSRNVVRVDLATDDVRVAAQFTRLGLQKSIEQIMALRILPDSPLQKHEGCSVQSNWRLRPGNGDNCLS